MSGERYEQVGWLTHLGAFYEVGRTLRSHAEWCDWQPVYVKVPEPEPEHRPTTVKPEGGAARLLRCPTCGSDNPSIYVTGTPQNPDRERCSDPWHTKEPS